MRFLSATRLVILIDAHPRHDWLLPAVEKRLREELAALQVEVNEEKSRIVDLRRGESFGFLGFDFRRIRGRRGAWRVKYTPKLKKRTALLRKLKGVFRRYRSQPVDRVICLINPCFGDGSTTSRSDTPASASPSFKNGWKRRLGVT